MNQNPNVPSIRIQPPLALLADILLGFGLKAFFPARIVPAQRPTRLQKIIPVKRSAPRPWARVATAALGLPLLLVGLFLGGAAVRNMMHAGTTPDPHRPVSELVTAGPYRFTRNPIYLGFVLMVLGIGFLANSLWFIPLAGALALTIQSQVIRYEEQYLENKFGNRYVEYKNEVRRWLGRK